MKYLSIIALFFLIVSCQTKPKLVKLSGPVFGTSYNIQYYAPQAENYTKEIDSLFYVINKSMSNYQTNSIISKLNRNETLSIDSHFEKVFNLSKQVYTDTKGTFDPTIGSLVNYWNFGAQKNEKALDSIKIDSLMRFVGFNKVNLKNKIINKQDETYIDFNAVAKGYGLDVIADFLESKNVINYLVEIGGEVRVKGKNTNKESYWKVGIQNPNFNGESNYNKAISLKNEAMATSGTYRKYKVDANGNRYAHIINTKTGYPTKTNVLSVSVIAKDCMTADAYATAFQAMGIEKTKSFLNTHPELKVYFIIENKDNEVENIAFNGFPFE